MGYLAYGSRGIGVHHGGEAWQEAAGMVARAHISYGTYRAKNVDWTWCESFNSRSQPFSDVVPPPRPHLLNFFKQHHQLGD